LRVRSLREEACGAEDGRLKLVETLIAAVAQFENDTKSQRTVEGMKEANRLGRWTWTAPIGYLNGVRRSPPSSHDAVIFSNLFERNPK